ncbi:cytochrome P450 [Streptomyces sp. NPDC054932]
MSKYPVPPGPRGHFLSGCLPEFQRDRLGFLTACAREHGDLTSFRLGPRRVYLASHPALIEQLLVTGERTFPRRPYLLTMNRVLFGNSLSVSHGEFWSRQRRLCHPAFRKSRVDATDSLMTSCAGRRMADWADGAVLDMHPEAMSLTLEIAAKTVFDIDVTNEGQLVIGSLQSIMDYLDVRYSSLLPLPDWVPTRANLRLRLLMRKLDAIVYDLIRERRASGEDRGDILSMLLLAEDEAGNRMPDAQVCDEAQNLFLAAVETTALSLCWTWYLLARHPEVEARLVEEWQRVLGGRPPTVADVPRLTYTDQVITESMRVQPPSYLTGREAAHDTDLGGYHIPKGSNVLISQWVLHRDARWFDAPEEFRPERWADGLNSRLPTGAYIPFGLGPRSCIAARFAWLEMVLLLTTVGQRFQLAQETPGRVVRPWPSFALRPGGGMRMRLRRRTWAEAPAPMR